MSFACVQILLFNVIESTSFLLMISTISSNLDGVRKSGVGRPLRGFVSESQMMNLMVFCQWHPYCIVICNIST